MDFRDQALAEEAAQLLRREDDGDLDAVPADATPFPGYDISHVHDGGVLIWHGSSSVTHRAVAISRHEALAKRVARALSRAHARSRGPWQGPVKSRYF